MAFNYEMNSTPSLSVGPASPRSVYTMASGTPSDIVIRQGAGDAPRISPEIGPDPRNFKSMIHLIDLPAMEGEGGVRFDFNNGYRIVIPVSMPSCLLRVYDLKTQVLLEERELAPGKLVVGERKYFIRYRLEVIERATLGAWKSLFADENGETEKPIAFVPPTWFSNKYLPGQVRAEKMLYEDRFSLTTVDGVRYSSPVASFAGIPNAAEKAAFIYAEGILKFPFGTPRIAVHPVDFPRLNDKIHDLVRLALGCKRKLALYRDL